VPFPTSEPGETDEIGSWICDYEFSITKMMVVDEEISSIWLAMGVCIVWSISQDDLQCFWREMAEVVHAFYALWSLEKNSTPRIV
jgi:hypothetical protein